MSDNEPKSVRLPIGRKVRCRAVRKTSLRHEKGEASQDAHLTGKE
jgi:hypothetical protein